MNIEKLKKKYSFTDENLEKIKKAVARVEKNTKGEIAVVASPSSSDYSFWELLAAVFFGLIAFVVMIPFTSEILGFLTSLFWTVEAYHLPSFMLMVVFLTILVFFFVANIPFIDRLIIPNKVKAASVYNKAVKEFVHRGVYNTKENTGILLYFSLFERKFQIIADKGISSKISQDEWNEIANMLASGFASKNPTDMIVSAIEKCGDILSQNFPADEVNENELPDGLVFVGGGL